jgi:hypothetical protein
MRYNPPHGRRRCKVSFTDSDGVSHTGGVFELTPSNGTWIYIDLHDFTEISEGGYPYGSVVRDASGNVFGTTSMGGTGCSGEGCGVVFEITPQRCNPV